MELAALNFASPQGVIGEIADPKSRLIGECDGSRRRIQSPDKSGAGTSDSVFAIPCWSAVWANKKGEKARVADRERIKAMKQLRIAETEKYAHVTFFFNGGREEPFAGEERILVPSPKVATYDLKPRLNRVNGVASVLVQGGQVPEFQVAPDPARMLRAHVGLQDVLDAIDGEEG